MKVKDLTTRQYNELKDELIKAETTANSKSVEDLFHNALLYFLERDLNVYSEAAFKGLLLARMRNERFEDNKKDNMKISLDHGYTKPEEE